MKDELCFLTQQQLQSSDEASLNELESLLSSLTPQQMNHLYRVHKVKRKDDLMYLNLWQLHEMGVDQPETVLALMRVALDVNLNQRTEDKQTCSDNNCLSDDIIHVVDDDDCAEPPLVIDTDANSERIENVSINKNHLLAMSAYKEIISFIFHIILCYFCLKSTSILRDPVKSFISINK